MTQCACGSHDTDVVTMWYEYRGYVLTVERSYTECQDCGLEFQTSKQTNEYAWQVKEVKFTIDQWIIDNPEE